MALSAGCGAEGAFGSLLSAGCCCAWTVDTPATKKNAPAITHSIPFRIRRPSVLSVRVLEAQIVGKPRKVVKEQRQFCGDSLSAADSILREQAEASGGARADLQPHH